jgi:basic amino acid/polyamine antiporter, APA family
MEAAAGAPGRAGEGRRGEEHTRLRRAIGSKVLTVFIIGDILGAGIYALVGEVGAEVGGAIWTSFLAAFVLALLTVFAYAELVSGDQPARHLGVGRGQRRPHGGPASPSTR